MKEIELSDLRPGVIASANYYSLKNELLIVKGVEISQSHLDSLKRRNISKLYIPLTEEEELIESLSKQRQSFGDLAIEPNEAQPESTPPEALRSAPLAASKQPRSRPTVEPTEELVSVGFGEAGFQRLLQSPVARRLDDALTSDHQDDAPSGTPLKASATQMPVGERTEQYVEQVSATYYQLLTEVRMFLDGIVGSRNINALSYAQNIVTRLVDILHSDKTILYNVANSCSEGLDYLYFHSLNVCILSICLASALNYNRQQIEEIGTGALLHDVGMFLIPSEIRLRKGKIDTGDWFEIQKHPILGLHLLEKFSNVPQSILYIIYQVHERFNAKGYPKMRGGRFIHSYAKAVQIADIYEALSHPRPHRKPFIPYEAMRTLVKMTQLNLISTEFVKAFADDLSLFPIGSYVLLSNGNVGRVVETNLLSPGKPVVSMVSIVKENGNPLLGKTSMYQLELVRDPSIYITKALASDLFASLGIMDGFYGVT